jgi:hypothetical protein
MGRINEQEIVGGEKKGKSCCSVCHPPYTRGIGIRHCTHIFSAINIMIENAQELAFFLFFFFFFFLNQRL